MSEDARNEVQMLGPGEIPISALKAPTQAAPTQAAPPPPQAPAPAPEPSPASAPSVAVEMGPGLVVAPTAAAPPPAAAPTAPAPPADAPFDVDEFEQRLRSSTVPYAALHEEREKRKELAARVAQYEPELQALRQVQVDAEKFKGHARQLYDDHQRVLAETAQRNAKSEYDEAWILSMRNIDALRAQGQDVKSIPYDPSSYLRERTIEALAAEVASLKQTLPQQLQNVLVNHDRQALESAVSARQTYEAQQAERAFRDGLKKATEQYPVLAMDESILVEQGRQRGFQVDPATLVQARVNALKQTFALGLSRQAEVARQMPPSVGAGGAAPAATQDSRQRAADAARLNEWLRTG